MSQPIKTEELTVGKKAAIRLTVNGKSHELNIEPSRRLVDVLRCDLDLTGTKISCGVGRCGACMVLLDGKPFNSCLTMVYQCEDMRIETIEGIENKEIINAFLEEGALQCGYCTPGMVISLQGELEKNSHPTEEELKECLSGNICRCTGYGGIQRVLQRLEEERRKQ
jgi:aerobic carbon-monoxide dehydrogenase small subunit